MLSSMLAWVTAGSAAPGVQCGSGSENNPDRRAWHEPGAGWGWAVRASAVPTATGSECGVVVPAPTGSECGVVVPAPAGSECVAVAPAPTGFEDDVVAP